MFTRTYPTITRTAVTDAVDVDVLLSSTYDPLTSHAVKQRAVTSTTQRVIMMIRLWGMFTVAAADQCDHEHHHHRRHRTTHSNEYQQHRGPRIFRHQDLWNCPRGVLRCWFTDRVCGCHWLSAFLYCVRRLLLFHYILVVYYNCSKTAL